MKKSNWIKILSVPSIAVVAATPLITLSGCGNHEMDTIAKLMTETAIDELYELIKIPHVTWMEGCPTPQKQWFDIDFSRMQNHFKDILIDEFGSEYAEENFHAQETYQNCWFDIPASEGCEFRPKLLLQAHMDMMWATKEGSIAEGWTNPWEKWDTYNVPLTIDRVNGHEALHTEGYITNNGSDDAQGLAVIAAVTRLHDKFKHGPIRCLLTNLEEVGAAGINELPKSVVTGYDNILNLDGNMLGDVTFSTAGAAWGDYTSDELRTATNWNDGFYRIKLWDGYGGHSGIDMHNNRENALHSLITFLWEINLRWASGLKAEVELINIKHKEGEGSSAIPSEASIDFIVRNRDLDFKTVQEKWNNERTLLSRHYNDKMQSSIEFINEPVSQYVGTKDSKAIIDLILEMDYGIQKQIEDLGVVTSRNITASLNLDAAGPEEHKLHIDAMGRSAYIEDLEKIENDYADAKEAAEEAGLILTEVEHTPVKPWYQPDTLLKNWYKESCNQAGFRTRDVMVHGGAEASIFVEKNENANIICIGSTLLGEHTINEVLYLDDYEQYIKSLLFLFKKVSEFDPPTPTINK